MVADKTIKVSEATKKKLDNLKENKRETYDDIISRLVILKVEEEKKGND